MTSAPPGTPVRTAQAAERIAGELLRTVPRRDLRGNVIREEIRAIVAECLGLVTSDGVPLHTRIARIHRAAARWAAIGVPIDTVQRLVHRGFRLHVNDLEAESTRRHDIRPLLDGLHAVTATVAKAYMEAAPGAHERPAHQVVAHALLHGFDAAQFTREHGAELTAQYTVLAVAADPAARDWVSAHGLLATLAERFGEPVPALHSPRGGTVLIPGLFPLADIRELVAWTTLSIVVTVADRERIPKAAEDGHELLDMVRRVYGTSGVYGFDDLALEYQITRPGPARDHLAAILDPLAEHPELMNTLRVHTANDMSRRHTARDLRVHENTVDNRLRRIHQLLGLDPHSAASMWQLRAALIARDYTTNR
ncbi:PucR family transcriptional regulator [Nocardia sp. NPDC055321]